MIHCASDVMIYTVVSALDVGDLDDHNLGNCTGRAPVTKHSAGLVARCTMWMGLVA